MTSTPSNLSILRRLLARGDLTCNLSDAGNEVAVLPLAYHWRNHETPFVGAALTVAAPDGDLDAVYAGIRAAPTGSVLVVATDGVAWAIWGETTTRLAQERGLAGVVLDGACRDVKTVRTAALPVVARGVSPKRAARSGLGTVGGTLALHGLTVHAGDVVVSDENGTAIIPKIAFNTIVNRLLELQEETV